MRASRACGVARAGALSIWPREYILAARSAGKNAFLITVERAGGQALFPIIPGRATVRKSLSLTLDRRGRHRLPEGTYRSIFPVNFFVRSFPAPLSSEATVFPAPRRCREAAAPYDFVLVDELQRTDVHVLGLQDIMGQPEPDEDEQKAKRNGRQTVHGPLRST